MKNYSNVLVALLKGIVYRNQESLWSELIKSQYDIKNYFNDVYLTLVIDDGEGYAYLKQQREEDADQVEFPKLVSKRQLPANVSLLCLLLRRDLIENERQGDTLEAYKSKQAIIDELKTFLPASTDEGKQLQKIKQTIKAVEELGFLRKLQKDENTYEVMRIIKAFIPADVVAEKLEEVMSHVSKNNLEEELNG